MAQTHADMKSNWRNLYGNAHVRLAAVPRAGGLISAFNSNVDAVIKIRGSHVKKYFQELGLKKEKLLVPGKPFIETPEDLFRGFLRCFRAGIAEEWLIHNIETFRWMENKIGYDKLQMGGQGGIIANTAAVCGVNPVYVHCASLPQTQAELFLDLDNLLAFDSQGSPAKACSIRRSEDALIHWILEFDAADKVVWENEEWVCPKSNRFIASYDPLNIKLHIDRGFQEGISKIQDNLGFILLSGYQMLTHPLPDGASGKERIDESVKTVKKWKEQFPQSILHFEFASTQDRGIRKHIVESLVPIVDSIGFNERELIDVLNVIGEESLANQCDQKTNSVNLFQGLHKIFKATNCTRIQLHMFGLYITISKKNAPINPQDNREGMMMAATIAAAKAGTGTIYQKENLLWAHGKEVSDLAIRELQNLAEYIGEKHGANELLETGYWEEKDFDLVAVPTIIVDQPVTLVGMGDTISSLSLIGARAK